MKITIIYGTMGKSSTATYVNLLLNRLRGNVNTDIDEFFLPKNFSQFCTKSSSFLENIHNDIYCGSKYLQSIMSSLDKANLIILAFPLYSCDETMQIKNLLDNMLYNSVSYRANPSVINKIGLIISSPDHVNLYHVNRLMKNSLKILGVKKIFKISNNASSIKSNTIDWTKKQKINNKISITSNKILRLLNNLDKPKRSLVRKLMFPAMKPIAKKNDWNVIYLNHFNRHRYLNQEYLNH